MKLDRNINNGRGKYALIEIRKLSGATADALFDGLSDEVTVPRRAVTIGDPNQFFVIKYKDRFAARTLQAYANAIDDDIRAGEFSEEESNELTEFSREIRIESYKASAAPSKIPS